jgi:hypothetical protein
VHCRPLSDYTARYRHGGYGDVSTAEPAGVLEGEETK